MNFSKNLVYENAIQEVKVNEPIFYQFLISELAPHEKHHYYHSKILDCFSNAIQTGFLPDKYQKELDLILSENKKFLSEEIYGNWAGTENDKIQFTLQLKSPSDFKVIRKWTEIVDGEEQEEIQEYKVPESDLIECDGLIILNLFFCDKKRAKIKLVLYPAIAFHKSLVGSLYMFLDDNFSGCTKVFLDKVDNAT